MKRYVTRKRKKISNCCYKDPNTDDRVNVETNGVTTFTETPYKISDGRFISVVEYPDDCTEESVTYFQTLDPDFQFTFIDESTANTLLEELGKDEQGNEYVTVDRFVFTDNRPLLER